MTATSVAARALACWCGGRRFAPVFRYEAPPSGEVRFRFAAGKPYQREVVRCEGCGHFRSVHELDATQLYAGDYVSANYQDDEGIRRAFERIQALEPTQSDNAGRVRRILSFAEGWFGILPPAGPARSILDIGSGLCVFLARMQSAGWAGTALDSDERLVRHARQRVGVAAIRGGFMEVQGLGLFDAVALNKVLEHVPDPEPMLRKALAHVAPGGFLYLEVPDGERAAAQGPEREEFAIDHWHVFSAASLALLVARAGGALQALERVRDPSGKFTLRAFAAPAILGAGA